MWQKKKQTGAEYKTVNTKQQNLKIIHWAGQNYVKSIVPKTRTFVMPFWYVSSTIHIYHKCKHAIFTRPKRNCIHIPSYFSIRNVFANIILPFAFNNCDLICNKHAQYMTHLPRALPHIVSPYCLRVIRTTRLRHNRANYVIIYPICNMRSTKHVKSWICEMRDIKK
jgi:hypothetical protein